MFDFGAFLQKLGGNQSANVIKGYNVLSASNPNNPYQSWMPYLQKEPDAPAQSPSVAKNDAPINDPLSGTYGNGGGGGGYAASANNIAGDRAYLDDQEGRLRRQLDSANRALGNGITQINDSYNQERDKANKNQSRALQDFALKREDTTRAKNTALNRVDTGARTLADSLRRRIGMASGSGSSAYQYAAPGAVAKQASEQRTGVQENYGTNFRNLDTGEKRVKADFEDLLRDLTAQRGQRESDFRSGILDRQNQIDNSLGEIARQRALLSGGGYNQVREAMSPYAASIDARQSEIDSLFDRFRNPYSVRAVDTSTPNLRDYTVDRTEITPEQMREADPSNPLRPREDDELMALY